MAVNAKYIGHSICNRFFNQSDQTDFVLITGDKKALQSGVGRKGRQQKIVQPRREEKIMYEMEIYHFQSSPIRDNHTRINSENIKSSTIEKSNKKSKLTDFNVRHYYGSIVHWKKTKYPISNLNTTIEHQNPKANDTVGQWVNLRKDVFLKINQIFECEA